MFAVISKPPRRSRGSRSLLAAVVLLVTALTAGCGSRLDQQAVVNALAPLAVQDKSPPPAGASAGQTLSDEQPSAAAPASVNGPIISTIVSNPAHGTSSRSIRTGDQAAEATQTAPAARSSSSAAARPPVASSSNGTPRDFAEPVPATTSARTANRSTLVFGNIGSYSGLFGAVEGGNKSALYAWVAMQNTRGGLDGHPIKLIIGDDQADPPTGLALMKRMIENDHILAFAGNLTAFGLDQYADYADSKAIPFIGGDATDPRWFTDPNLFPAIAPAAGAIQAGLRYFVNQGATRIGMAYCLEVAKLCGYLNDTTVKSPIGNYIVDDEQVSLVAPSYTSQCLRMQADKVEVLYELMDTAAAARMAQNCASQGYKPKIMVLSLNATAEFPKVEALRGAYIPGSTVPPSETQIPAVTEFHIAMDKYAPGVGDSGFGELGWADGLVLGRAGVHLPDNPTAADLKTNLWKIKNDDLGGFGTPLTFPQGKPAVPSTCVFLWGVKDHTFYAPQGPRALC